MFKHTLPEQNSLKRGGIIPILPWYFTLIKQVCAQAFECLGQKIKSALGTFAQSKGAQRTSKYKLRLPNMELTTIA